MKSNQLLTTVAFIATSTLALAQPTGNCATLMDDFSSSTGWVHPILAPAVSSPSNYNTLNIASGTFNFQQSRDQNLNYFYRTGVAISNTNFKVNVDFQHNVNHYGAGHIVLGLTDGTEHLLNDTLTGTGVSILNGIGVMFMSDLNNAPNDYYFQVVLNTGGVISNVGFPIHMGVDPLGTINDYYLELHKIGSTTGVLNLYYDAGRTLLRGSSGLFAIPTSLVGLNTVQFGTDFTQHMDRMLVSKIDNLCIDDSPLGANTNPNICGMASDDFSNPAIWGHPILPAPLACNTYPTMQINSGMFKFLQSRDNNFNFMNRSIPTVSNTEFTADIDFEWITNGIGGGIPSGLPGVGHTLLALNDGFEPFFSSSSSIGTPGMSCSATPLLLSTNSLKGIAVTFESDLPEDATDHVFKVYINNGGGTFPTMVSTPISTGLSPAGSVMYYIRLERFGTTNGKLTIYSDMARTIVVGASTFSIPSSITNLNVVQLGGNEWQEEPRMLTANMDNLCIKNSSSAGLESDNLLNANIKIYPNPATSILTIQSDKEVKSIEIVNIGGQVVQSSATPFTSKTISIETLPSGIYFIKLQQEDLISTHKIIKN